MFGKSPMRERIVAIADLQSNSASFSIVEMQGAKNATIHATRSIELPLEERSWEHHVFVLKEKFAETGKRVFSDYALLPKSHAVKKIYAIVHAPWTQGVVIKAAIAFSEEMLITPEILSDTAKKALNKAPKPTSAALLDATQLSILLNGYPTNRPEGKSAQSVEVVALMTACDEDVKEHILSVLYDVAPAVPAVLHSGARAIVGAIQAARPHLRSAVCVHVSGEGTELITLRGGIVVQYASANEGLRSILERAFPGKSADEARAALRLSNRRQSAESLEGSMQEALVRIEPELAHLYGEALSKMSTPLRLPNALLLVASPDMTVWLKNFFGRIDFSQFTTTAQPFEVEAITADELGGTAALSSESADLDISLAVAHVLQEEYGR